MGVHEAGERRAAWVRGRSGRRSWSLSSGRFRMEFPDQDVVLSEQGQYVIWGKGVDHSWEAEEPSVVMTVRWPSVPGYRVSP